jgi:spore germination protein YaaH
MSPIPDGVAPHQVDLYLWRDQAWIWQPAQAGNGGVQVELEELPQAAALVQRTVDDTLVEIATATVSGIAESGSITSFSPVGLTVTPDGAISGRASLDTVTGMPVIPVVQGSQENLNQLFNTAEARKQHLDALLDLANDDAFAGVELDYQGLSPDFRPELTAFLTDLHRQLSPDSHLVVRVTAPQPLGNNRWDTGVFDWDAIGDLANTVKVPVIPHPEAYDTAGQIPALVAWAITRINREKVQLLLYTGSSDWVGGVTRELPMSQGVEPLGQATLSEATDREYLPGQPIDMSLKSGLPTTGIQVTQGVYWYGYLDENNQHHTVYLDGMAAVVPVFAVADTYNLGGVTLSGENAVRSASIPYLIWLIGSIQFCGGFQTRLVKPWPRQPPA